MIIDASVALKWLVEEDGSDRAQNLLEQVDLMAPTLLHAEVANGLHRKLRRGELEGGTDLIDLIGSLASFVQTIDEVPVIPRALALAASLNHAVYDCVYLALAEQLDRPLVTADIKFLTKVGGTSLAQLMRSL